MNDQFDRPLEPEDGDDDSQAAPQSAPQSAFTLPAIREMEITRVRYEVPRPYYVGRDRIECSNGVEFMINTDGPIPIRALSPILFVGDVEIDAYEELGENNYRFIAYLTEELKEGDQISFGWGRGSAKFETNFMYEPGSEEEDR
ncbi:MAG: hypothetical protein IH872_02965 [Chloroflexi bacterium]|nr:hypothetical protein [Chloroflexota bacterium]